MRLTLPSVVALLWLCEPSYAFVRSSVGINTPSITTTKIFVSIGIGPEAQKEGEEEKEFIAGIDYEVPDHEAYRTSRRSKLDEQCDKWFGSLLGGKDDKGILGSLADDAREILLTPVTLENEVCIRKNSPSCMQCPKRNRNFSH
jgi:hypothetical protein